MGNTQASFEGKGITMYVIEIEILNSPKGAAKIIVDQPNLSEITNLLESSRNVEKFRVLDGNCVLTQNHFGYGGYLKWVSQFRPNLIIDYIFEIEMIGG